MNTYDSLCTTIAKCAAALSLVLASTLGAQTTVPPPLLGKITTFSSTHYRLIAADDMGPILARMDTSDQMVLETVRLNRDPTRSPVEPITLAARVIAKSSPNPDQSVLHTFSRETKTLVSFTLSSDRTVWRFFENANELLVLIAPREVAQTGYALRRYALDTGNFLAERAFDVPLLDVSVRNAEVGVLAMRPSEQNGLLVPVFERYDAALKLAEQRPLSDLFTPGVQTPVGYGCFVPHPRDFAVNLGFLGRAVLAVMTTPRLTRPIGVASCDRAAGTFLTQVVTPGAERLVSVSASPEGNALFRIDVVVDGLLVYTTYVDHVIDMQFDGKKNWYLASRRCAQPAPSACTFDGTSVWVLDVVEAQAGAAQFVRESPRYVPQQPPPSYADPALGERVARAKPIWELYNVYTGHFFYVMEGSELDAIINRNSAGPGWHKIRAQFRAWADGEQPDFAIPVCRFFRDGLYSGPRNTAGHFMTARQDECKSVAKDYPGWVFESPSVFWVLPFRDIIELPADTYVFMSRAYNNRGAVGDANHRYPASFDDSGHHPIYGWIDELNSGAGTSRFAWFGVR